MTGYAGSPSVKIQNPLADAARRRVSQGYGPATPQSPMQRPAAPGMAQGAGYTAPRPMAQRAASAFSSAPMGAPMGMPPTTPPAPMSGAALASAPMMAPAAGMAPSMGSAPAMGPPMGPGAAASAFGGDMFPRGAGGGHQDGGGGSGYARDPISEDNPNGRFDIRNPKQWGKFINRLNLRDYFKASGPLWEQIGNLQNEANTDQFSDERRAQYLAPEMENISDQTKLAQGQYDQAMSDRGLTDSSANALGQSNILSRAGGARAGLVHDLHNEELAAKKDAQAQLMQALGAMSGRGIGNSQQGWSSQQQLQLQRYLADMQNQGGGLFGDLFGGLGALGGLAGGLGWSPFGSGASR